jgi:hypothetical protein
MKEGREVRKTESREHLEPRKDEGHGVRAVRSHVEEDDNAFPGVDHAPEGAPVAPLHRE